MKNQKNHIFEFDKKGVCIIKGLFGKKEMQKLHDYSQEIKNLTPKPGEIMKYYEKSVLNKKKEILVRSEFFYDFHKNLKKFLDSKKIHNILKQLMRGKCILFKEKINYKPPGCRADKVHQDSQGNWDKYTKKYISMLVSIEKSTKKNGCLEFDFSGNNKDASIGKSFKPLHVSRLNKPNFRYVELDVGDAVFFNHYVPHRSNSNKSLKTRTQLYITYNLKKAGNYRKKYFREKRRNFPPNNERTDKKNYKYLI